MKKVLEGGNSLGCGKVFMWGLFGLWGCTRSGRPAGSAPTSPEPLSSSPMASAPTLVTNAPLPPLPKSPRILIVGDSSVTGNLGHLLYQELASYYDVKNLFLFGACGATARYWTKTGFGETPPCEKKTQLAATHLSPLEPSTLGALVKVLKPDLVILSLGIFDNLLNESSLVEHYKELMAQVAEVPRCHFHGPVKVSHAHVSTQVAKIYKALVKSTQNTSCTLYPMNVKSKNKESSVLVESNLKDGIGVEPTSGEAKKWVSFVVNTAVSKTPPHSNPGP